MHRNSSPPTSTPHSLIGLARDGGIVLHRTYATSCSLVSTFAVTKGCDSVDLDNVDGYANDNGLAIDPVDAVAYLKFLADTAYSCNQLIGPKNADIIVPDIFDRMEWSEQEQCNQYSDGSLYRSFIDQAKPVFRVEYPKGAGTNSNASITAGQKTSICTDSGDKGFSTIIKNINLDQWIETCG